MGLFGNPEYEAMTPAEKVQWHRDEALGNSMAVPVMAHIGRRIQMVQDILDRLESNDAA